MASSTALRAQQAVQGPTAAFTAQDINGIGKWSLTFPTIPGYHYSVEESQDLVNWTPSANGQFYGNGQSLQCYICDGPLPAPDTGPSQTGPPANAPVWTVRMIYFKLEMLADGAGTHCLLSRAEDTPFGATTALAAWDVQIGNVFPLRPAGTRIYPLLDAYDNVNHISYMASVTVVTTTEGVPVESFPQSPEQAAEAAVFEQIKPQLIGRLLVGDEDPVPPVPSPHKYARLRRSEIDANGNGLWDWWELAYGYNAFALSNQTGYCDPSADADNDELTNLQEQAAGSNPDDPDTDKDGFYDGEDSDAKDKTKHPPAVTYLLTALKYLSFGPTSGELSFVQFRGANWGLDFPIDDPGPQYFSVSQMEQALAAIAFPGNAVPGALKGQSLGGAWVAGNFAQWTPGAVILTDGEVQMAKCWLVHKPIETFDVSTHYLLSGTKEDQTTIPHTTTKTGPTLTTITVKAGKTISDEFPMDPELSSVSVSGDNYYIAANKQLVPFGLLTDLNNDGVINLEDGIALEAAQKPGASDEVKAKGTEYMFINDKMSNGVWDADDEGVTTYTYGSGYGTLPKPPVSHKSDDDAEALQVSVGVTSGFLWFEHPALAKLEFFKTKECKAVDRIDISSTVPYNLSGEPLPTPIFMRLKENWLGVEQTGDLRMFVGKSASEIWGETKIPLTVIGTFGAKHYFHAARDYILENNTRLCIRDVGYPVGTEPETVFRLCMMREEATKLTALDVLHGGLPGEDPAVMINGSQCYFAAGWDEANPLDLAAMLQTVADKCHGRVIHGGATALTSSDNFDETTKPAKGSLLAGPDPIPQGNIAGPDGLPGTADDIPNPSAGQAGGKYVSETAGVWTFAAGQAAGSEALGGMSTFYASPLRANKAHQMLGFSKGWKDGEGCIFTATQIRGEGFATMFKADAARSEVPALNPSVDGGAIKLFILDSGAGSLFLGHRHAHKSFHNGYVGRKRQFGVPYYVNNYLAFAPDKPRP